MCLVCVGVSGDVFVCGCEPIQLIASEDCRFASVMGGGIAYTESMEAMCVCACVGAVP